jgi:hypothetical protein
MRRTVLILSALLLWACSDDDVNNDPKDGSVPPDKSATAEASVDKAVPDTGLPTCGTAMGTIPSTATELKFDDGTPKGNIRDQTWTITSGAGYKYELAKIGIMEAVRFELKHPAKILGAQVMWAKAPTDPKSELKIGLYRDFGTNGVDFWKKTAPLWSGTRCVRDHKDKQWLTYTFKTPVEVKRPGYIYLAQDGAKATSPSFYFADAAVTKCTKTSECNSVVNIPKAPDGYNGLSFLFQYNFMVRLFVQYTENVKPTETIFQKASSAPTGRHIAWGDYDNDGYDDALVAGKLYHNVKGTFTDVSKTSGISGLGYTATSGAWGDYNNDGCMDLLLFAETPARADALMKGDCKGTFTDVTKAAGITDKASYLCGGKATYDKASTAAAAWFDLDNDGYLDIYLANGLCSYKTSSGASAEANYVDSVWRNKGDGTFEELSKTKGFTSEKRYSRGTAPADIDDDGDTDLFVLAYRLQANYLYRNNGDGTVTDIAKTSGAIGHPYNLPPIYYGHTIGAAWGDMDNDGDLDLLAANLAHPRFFHFSDKTQLLLNDGKGKFTDAAGLWTDATSASGLLYRETHSVPVLADFDNDTNLDLCITSVYAGRPTDFYWGKGKAKFDEDNYHAGITTSNGWGLAAADYDNDGDQDLFATDLYVNGIKGTKKGKWLQVRALAKTKSNYMAIGANVRVTAGGKTYLRHVQGSTGKGGQDTMYLHFGLGTATSVDKVEVTYPGKPKTTVTFKGPFKTEQRLWVYDDGTVTKGWAPK